MEREEASLKPLLVGALLGLVVGILFAPQSGEETRRVLKRRLRKARALAEEKVGELTDRLGEQRKKAAAIADPEEERNEIRSELERRLAEARARRQRPADDDDEEPVA